MNGKIRSGFVCSVAMIILAFGLHIQRSYGFEGEIVAEATGTLADTLGTVTGEALKGAELVAEDSAAAFAKNLTSGLTTDLAAPVARLLKEAGSAAETLSAAIAKNVGDKVSVAVTSGMEAITKASNLTAAAMDNLAGDAGKAAEDAAFTTAKEAATKADIAFDETAAKTAAQDIGSAVTRNFKAQLEGILDEIQVAKRSLEEKPALEEPATGAPAGEGGAESESVRDPNEGVKPKNQYFKNGEPTQEWKDLTVEQRTYSKDLQDAVDQAASAQEAQLGAGGRVIRDIKSWATENPTAADKVVSIGQKLLGGALHILENGMVMGIAFALPNWILGAIQGHLTWQSQMTSVAAPQYFGGIWMRIPTNIINTIQPEQTVPLYGKILDQTAPSPSAELDNFNYFTSGGNCAYNNWGQALIVSTGYPAPFLGQMIHLNTGLEFYANGYPTSSQYPYKQLYGDQQDFANNCPWTLEKYLIAFAGRIEQGTFAASTVTSYGGIPVAISTSGGQAASAGAPSTVRANLEKLAKVLYTSGPANPRGAEYVNIFTKKSSSGMSSIDQLNEQFVVGLPVQRDSRSYRIKGGFALRSVQPLSEAVQNALKNSSFSPASMWSGYNSQNPFAAQSVFVYETKDTQFATKMNKIFAASNNAALTGNIVDYVVCLDASMSYIAGYTPQMQANGSITWAANPQTYYILSLVDGTLYTTQPSADTSNVATGVTAPTMSQNQTFANAMSAAFGGTNFNSGIAKYYAAVTSLITALPLTYGEYTLTIPAGYSASQMAQVPIYAIDPAHNNGKSTLALSATTYGIDYVVPLTTSITLTSPLPVPSSTAANMQHAYFASLVTSQVYDTQFNPAPTIQFNILQYPVSQPTAGYVAPVSVTPSWATVACPTLCSAMTTPLATLYMDQDINPYNGGQLLGQINQAISQSLANGLVQGANAPFSGAPAAITDVIIDYITSFAMMGLTPTVCQQLTTIAVSAGTNSVVSAIAAPISNALIALFLSNAANQALTTIQNATTPQQIIDALNTLLSNNPFQGIVFSPPVPSSLAKLIATTLAAVNPTQTPTAPMSSLAMAQQGFIPTGTQFIYQTIQLYAGSNPSSIQAYLTTNAPTLNTAIATQYTNWRTYLVSAQDPWLAYTYAGPFVFANEIPTVYIFASSVADIQAGNYVYHVTGYPGDYFVVNSSATLPATTQQFTPANPQLYLISLVTGHVYERTIGSNSPDTIAPAQNAAGFNLVIPQDQVASFVQGLTPSLQKSIKNSAGSVATPASTWPVYQFGTFILTRIPQDAQAGIPIYENITGLSGILSQTTKTPLKSLLGQVTDFLIPVNASSTPITYAPLTAKTGGPDHLLSLITGNFYLPSGAIDTTPSIPQTGTPPASQSALSWALYTGTAGAANIKQSAAYAYIYSLVTASTQAPALFRTTKSSESMPASLFTNLTTLPAPSSIVQLAAPYSNLVLANNSIYGVVNLTGNAVTQIIDYNVQIADQAAVVSYAPVSIGTSNNAAQYLITGWAAQRLRDVAGLYIDDGILTLGVPNATIALPVPSSSTIGQAGQSQLSAETLNLSLSTPYAGAFSGTYQPYYFTPASTGSTQMVLAHYAPDVNALQRSTSFVDLYSGTQYAPDGNPLIATYQAYKDMGADKIAAVVNIAGAGQLAGGAQTTASTQIFGPFAMDGGQNNPEYQAAYPYYFLYSDQKSQVTPSTQTYELYQASSLATLGSGTQYPFLGVSQTQPANAPNYMVSNQASSWSVVFGSQASGASSQTFGPAHTFNPSQEQISLYTYLGSVDPATAAFAENGSQPIFVGNKIANNPAYASWSLIISVDNKKVKRIFVMPPTIQNAPGYIELRRSSGNTFKSAAIGITYTLTWFGTMTSPTGAQYVAIQDSKGVHFYAPQYLMVDGGTITTLQNQLNAYLSNQDNGNYALFPPLPTLNLTAAIVENIPVGAQVASSQLWQNGSQYLYQFNSTTDISQPYYRSNAAYVDLANGVLYTSSGAIVGDALTTFELQLLKNTNSISLTGSGSQLRLVYVS